MLLYNKMLHALCIVLVLSVMCMALNRSDVAIFAIVGMLAINFYHNCCTPQSDGELLGDEHTAAIAIRMAQSCNKLMNTFSRKANFNRLSGELAYGVVAIASYILQIASQLDIVMNLLLLFIFSHLQGSHTGDLCV